MGLERKGAVTLNVPLVEKLAHRFVEVPLRIYGVYRTALEPDQIYSGHVDQPTTKCAVIISLRGQADFIFDGAERYRLGPGTALLGGLRRQLEIHTAASGFEYCLVHYLPEDSGNDMVRLFTEVTMLHASLDPELLYLQEQLLRSSSSPGGMGLLEKKALFYRLLDKLLQSERHHQNKDSHTLIEETIQYIQAHYAEPLTLGMLANRCHMGAKYFSYLFRKYVGVGPIDYLIRYRMNRAYELLISGKFSVAFVAKSVGYSDAYYFSRLFKKHKGLSPGKVSLYRRRNSPS